MTRDQQTRREACTTPSEMCAMAMMVAAIFAPFGTLMAVTQPAQFDPTTPVFELREGERYFRTNGAPTFVLGRNPVGVNPEAFDAHFQNAAAAGEQIHADSLHL